MKDFTGTPSTPTYKLPEKGLLSYLPVHWVPYAELMRLSKPVGIMNIYFPYLFGSLYAASITEPIAGLSSLFSTNIVLFVAAFVLRSAGCTWNDIIDCDLDRQVARCRLRPMARGAIPERNAYIFTAAQGLVWVSILSQICPQYWLYSAPLVAMVAFYPFAKRLTNYAQVVLGFTLGWGVLIGCLANGVDPMTLVVEKPRTTGGGLVFLYLCYVVWCVIHDTVYAQQDIQDDLKAGIGSMAVSYRGRMKGLLSTLSAVQLGCLILTGILLDAGLFFYLGACFGTAVLLVLMVWQLNLGNPVNCLWWFQHGSSVFGATVFFGLFTEYMDRLVGRLVIN